jgi:hypothetical protein
MAVDFLMCRLKHGVEHSALHEFDVSRRSGAPGLREKRCKC